MECDCNAAATVAEEETSTSGRGNPLDAPLGGGRSRYSAVVLDLEGTAAEGSLRECCVFVVPQVRMVVPGVPQVKHSLAFLWDLLTVWVFQGRLYTAVKPLHWGPSTSCSSTDEATDIFWTELSSRQYSSLRLSPCRRMPWLVF